jgi:hypothetical protein
VGCVIRALSRVVNPVCVCGRIEDNVDDAHESVSRAKDWLLGVQARLSSNGPLVIKSMAVLILFMIFFILFVA